MDSMTSEILVPTGQDPIQGQGCLGSTLLFLGASLILLGVIENISEPQIELPRFWTEHRSICYFVSLAIFVGGCGLLQRPTQLSESWSPSREGRRFERVVLFTRDGCHLCDHAKDTLLKYRMYLPTIEETSVDSDPDLAELFGACVPVVEIDGKVRFRGNVDEILLRRLIEGTRPA